jgi:putative intracellular protease/amidase
MRILIPLPARDGDPSEIAVPWRVLRAAGHELVVATPQGTPAQADPVMLSGEGLDPWGCVPGLRKLRLIGLVLRANATARSAWRELEGDADFAKPLAYAALRAQDFDALLLPGGHAQGVREYLESADLQRVVAAFFDAQKPVAAICHGVLLAARSIGKNGHSVLHGRKTTALTWKLEKSAWDLTRFFARWWDRHYYRTYSEQPGEPAGYRSVQAEVTRALADPADFRDVESSDFRRGAGLFRDSATDASPAFVVRDGHYVSARWPGDVHAFAHAFADLLRETASA